MESRETKMTLQDEKDLLIFKAVLKYDMKTAAEKLGMSHRNLQKIKIKKPLLWAIAQYTSTTLKSNLKKASPCSRSAPK